MRARSVPLGSMFAWISSTFRLVFNNMGDMALASLLSLLVALACYLPLFGWMIKVVATQGTAGMLTIDKDPMYWVCYAVSALVGLVVMAPMLAGWMRMCAAADRGEAAGATQVFSVLYDTPRWLRLLGMSLLVGLVVLVVGALLYLVFGDAFRALVAIQESNNAAMLGGQRPPPVDGAMVGQIFKLYAVVLPILLVLQVAYMIAAAEIGLTENSAVGALGDSVLGILRNLVKLIVFGLCMLIFFIIFAFVAAMVIGVAMMALMAVNQVLAIVMVFIMYIAILLTMYPLAFAFNFYMWKDMLGDAAEGAAGNAVAA